MRKEPKCIDCKKKFVATPIEYCDRCDRTIHNCCVKILRYDELNLDCRYCRNCYKDCLKAIMWDRSGFMPNLINGCPAYSLENPDYCQLIEEGSNSPYTQLQK